MPSLIVDVRAANKEGQHVRADHEQFLSGERFAVAGASNNRTKFGNKVLRALWEAGRSAIPIHPTESEVEGKAAVARVGDMEQSPDSLSIVTPPAVTRAVVEDAVKAGVKTIWMQPGAEDATASAMARDAGILVIDDGSCVLVALRQEPPR